MTAHDDLATLRKGIGCIGHAFKWVYEGEVATSQCDRGECHRCRFEEALSRLEVELARLREKLEWVKHALPPSASDELTEWLDGNQEASE